MKEESDKMKIVGSVSWIDKGKRRKKILYRIEGDVRTYSLEVDAQKDYTEDELKKLIAEAMRNEQ